MEALRWRGVLAPSSTKQRMMIALVTVAFSLSLTFMQLGFVGVVLPASATAYAVLLLMPVATGALALGTGLGALIGALAGLGLYAHSIFMPLDFSELAMVTPLSSVVLLSACGLLSGVLFSLAIKHGRSIRRSIGYLALACIVVSWFFSVGFNGYALLLLAQGESSRLSVSEFAALFADDVISTERLLGGMVVQAWIDSLIMALLCGATFAIAEWLVSVQDDIGIRMVFSISIVIVAILAFVITAALSFVTVTISERTRAEASMRSEVNYLCLQLESQAARAEAFGRVAQSMGIDEDDIGEAEQADYAILTSSVGEVVSGYTMQETGTVALIEDGSILVTDDERLTVGADVGELLGEDVLEAIESCVRTGELQRIPYDGVLSIANEWVSKTDTLQIAYLLAAVQGDYTVMIIEPSSMFYRNRSGVLSRQTVISVILLTVICVLVSRLLENVVALRIDQTNESLGRITAGELDTRVQVLGTREFKSLSKGINHTVDALNGWIAEAETRMDSELAAARAIQEAALPRTFPPFPEVDEFDLYAIMDPAREVGGDFYDFFLIEDAQADSTRLGFVIADVAGKGVPAALLMMRAKALIRDAIQAGMDLGKAIESANDQVCEGNEATMFVTAWIGVLDFASGHMEYVNAGHNPPLMRHDGDWGWLKERSGAALGVFEGLPYRTRTLKCRPGDKLLLYTDGVTEAMSMDNEVFGEERLAGVARGRGDRPARDLASSVHAAVQSHERGAEQSDDITILVLEFFGPRR